MALFGPPDVKILEAKGDVKGLINALSYKVGAISDDAYKIRRNAAEALERIGDARAVNPLISVANRPDGVCSSTEKEVALRALASIRDVRAVDSLLAALNNKNTAVVQAAVKALGNIGSPKAVMPLISALSNKDRFVVTSAVGALGKLGDPRSAEPLIALLDRKDEYVTKYVAEALGKIGDRKAAAPLVAILHNKTFSGVFAGDLYTAAARALGSMRYDGAVETLLALLEENPKAAPSLYRNKGSDIRAGLVDALGMCGDERAVNCLISILMDGQDPCRCAAAKALEKLHWQPDESAAGATYYILQGDYDRCIPIGTPAVQPLIDAIESGSYDKDPAVIDLAKTLAGIGDQRAVIPLIAYLNKPIRSLFSEEDGEIYAAGAAAEQEHIGNTIRQRKAIIEILQEFVDMDKIDQNVKISLTDFLNTYSVSSDIH